ncbi:MAG: hypothetical protein LBU42_00470 [Prevotellaceae bacterium]|nr:hypothetical protein [Prevotellaceae bacterium]
MKKTLFFFALLAGATAFAQATVTPISVNYDNQQVTFGIAWTTSASNRVWVWVDFCSVTGTTLSTFTPATISPVSVTGGSYDGQNGRGFYVYGNPTTVTATLSNTTGKFNWCAYGSDYPPNIGDYNNGIYTLRGTPPFTLKGASGETSIVSGTTLTQSSLTFTPITMTDATGCPGYFCKYVGMDLHMNASYPCQQRASGAKNWEAYIKDSRDDLIYRIVQFSDNSWWMAEDLNIYQNVIGICSGKHFYRSNNNTVCPPGWLLPTFNEVVTRWPGGINGAMSDIYGGAWEIGSCYDNGCCNVNVANRIDIAILGCLNIMFSDVNNPTVWYWGYYNYNYACAPHPAHTDIAGRVRCTRQL